MFKLALPPFVIVLTIFGFLTCFVQETQSISALCDTSFECFNQSISISNNTSANSLTCNGYSSCRDCASLCIIGGGDSATLSISSQSQQLNCYGSYSCYNIDKIIVTSLNFLVYSVIRCYDYFSCAFSSLITGTQILCHGEKSCINTNISLFSMNDSNSDDSSLMSYGDFSVSNSIVSKISIIRGIGRFDFYNTSIYSSGIKNMSVYLWGYYSGMNLNIYCEYDDTCNIHCHGNGCYGTSVYCENNSTCVITCDNDDNDDDNGNTGTGVPSVYPSLLPSKAPSKAPTSEKSTITTLKPNENNEVNNSITATTTETGGVHNNNNSNNFLNDSNTVTDDYYYCPNINVASNYADLASINNEIYQYKELIETGLYNTAIHSNEETSCVDNSDNSDSSDYNVSSINNVTSIDYNLLCDDKQECENNNYDIIDGNSVCCRGTSSCTDNILTFDRNNENSIKNGLFCDGFVSCLYGEFTIESNNDIHCNPYACAYTKVQNDGNNSNNLVDNSLYCHGFYSCISIKARNIENIDCIGRYACYAATIEFSIANENSQNETNDSYNNVTEITTTQASNNDDITIHTMTVHGSGYQSLQSATITVPDNRDNFNEYILNLNVYLDSYYSGQNTVTNCGINSLCYIQCTTYESCFKTTVYCNGTCTIYCNENDDNDYIVCPLIYNGTYSTIEIINTIPTISPTMAPTEMYLNETAVNNTLDLDPRPNDGKTSSDHFLTTEQIIIFAFLVFLIPVCFAVIWQIRHKDEPNNDGKRKNKQNNRNITDIDSPNINSQDQKIDSLSPTDMGANFGDVSKKTIFSTFGFSKNNNNNDNINSVNMNQGHMYTSSNEFAVNTMNQSNIIAEFGDEPGAAMLEMGEKDVTLHRDVTMSNKKRKYQNNENDNIGLTHNNTAGNKASMSMSADGYNNNGENITGYNNSQSNGIDENGRNAESSHSESERNEDDDIDQLFGHVNDKDNQNHNNIEYVANTNDGNEGMYDNANVETDELDNKQIGERDPPPPAKAINLNRKKPARPPKPPPPRKS